MNEIVKHINDTNASYRTPDAGNAKNTDLFLDTEHYELFRGAGNQVTVRFNKENLAKAILFIASILPRKYDNRVIHKTISYSSDFVIDQLIFLDYYFKIEGKSVTTKTQTWNARKDVPKKNGEIDHRFYFNGLLEDVDYVNSKGESVSSKFTIRDFLAGGYSDLHIKKAEDGIFDVWITNALEPFFDKKEDGLEELDKGISKNEPLQQIFYGAPGTGKSFHVDEVCKKHEHFRTTFHPDSDYSTFVGCYKPSMTSKVKIYSQGELISKLTEIKKTGTTYPCHKFAATYWESLTELSKEETIAILKACDFSDSMYVEIGKGIAIGQDMARRTEDSKIVYKFTPQAFTNAYIKAWELHESNTPVYLVVEEINRGNCAQIFGDLFQLLDRNNKGYSTYEITPDTDLQDYISQQGLNISGITDSDGKDISNKIASGELMKLPNNLYIWATMNTSDQSLFPIDSAFKRRWDWKYIPIKYANKDWKVVLKDESYCKWTELQTILNDLIYDATESEDKMLGDWFVKAENDVISEEVLVGKIIFYLWNDVAKVDAGKLFDLEVEKRGKKRKVIFSDFYNADGTINSEIVKNWLKKISVTLTEKETTAILSTEDA